jgi:hypothetical protein
LIVTREELNTKEVLVTATPEATASPIVIANTTTPTETPVLTPTKMFTPTPAPQIFSRIFPEEFFGAGVASHHYCTADDIGCLHFDVGLPSNFTPELDPILAPASGYIVEHYIPGGQAGGQQWGEVLTIEPDIPLEGIEQLIMEFGFSPSRVWYVYYHVGHIIPWKSKGDYVEVGEALGTPKNMIQHVTEWKQWANFVAFVVRIGVSDGEIQVSPCKLPNNYYWCNICYPGAVERNPCP